MSINIRAALLCISQRNGLAFSSCAVEHRLNFFRQIPKYSNASMFTISAIWDDEASVLSGHCDDIPAAADAPSIDELLQKISMMAMDVLPDNHPGVDPASLQFQIATLGAAP